LLQSRHTILIIYIVHVSTSSNGSNANEREPNGANTFAEFGPRFGMSHRTELLFGSQFSKIWLQTERTERWQLYLNVQDGRLAAREFRLELAETAVGAGGTSTSMYAVHTICSSGSETSPESAASIKAVPSSLGRFGIALDSVEPEVLLMDCRGAVRSHQFPGHMTWCHMPVS
jgi:hypothetical protein